MRTSRLARLALVTSLAAGGAACTHVRPHERGLLAHPTMAAEPLEGPAHQHMYSVHEGAAGGRGVAESGCGCN
jgi:hypothetical protein